MEGLAGQPDARHGRVQIIKDTQDASTTRGAGREGIDVQQVIAFVPRQVASLLFQRTEAGEVENQLARIGREKRRYEICYLPGVLPHDAMQALLIGGIISGGATQEVLLGTVRDIFVKARAGLLLRDEKGAVIGRQIKRYFGKKQDAPGLKLAAVPERALARMRSAPAGRILVIPDFQPGTGA